jgi:hypothetical protein
VAELPFFTGGFGRLSHRHAFPLCFNIFNVAEILGCFSAVAEPVEAIAEKRGG